MHNFSDQCLDLARALLGNNLKHINEDGTITPATNESSRVDEPGHAALAIGEFFRATGEVELAGFDLFDLSARCITHQAFSEEASDNGMAYAALGLLSFGASKERNPVWERLLDPHARTARRVSSYTDGTKRSLPGFQCGQVGGTL